ncbi:MAG: hypothetical protein HY912_22275 [Desulfomonile tiedjei]|uniref:Uncharacterized protein n=1 Tax=Desulfomonile tiedjei TaxID=2358 RepID=A0A9D6V519_9BACT|nr:hypothetical protein [Desulfomonile tiedjei]
MVRKKGQLVKDSSDKYRIPCVRGALPNPLDAGTESAVRVEDHSDLMERYGGVDRW